MLAGQIKMPKLDGTEIAPGIWLIGEGTPIPGTNKLRCLAQVGAALCLVELVLKFGNSSST